MKMGPAVIDVASLMFIGGCRRKKTVDATIAAQILCRAPLTLRGADVFALPHSCRRHITAEAAAKRPFDEHRLAALMLRIFCRAR
jgi:hypothetical protein